MWSISASNYDGFIGEIKDIFNHFLPLSLSTLYKELNIVALSWYTQGSLSGTRRHTVLFSEVTLDENRHPFWARGMLGEGLDHMWSEYEQMPASHFWEKLEKPLFYYKKRSRLSPQ